MKKALALILALVLVLSLAACGGSSTGATTAATAAAAENTPEAAEFTPQPLKALVLYNSSVGDFNDEAANPVLTYIKEATGYDISYDVLPAESPYDKVNGILASGTYYDFIIIKDKDYYTQYASWGALLDMKALVEQYAPNVAANISEAAAKILTIGDTYYAIPNMSPSGREDSANVSYGMMYRADVLEQLGLEKPTTTEEFADMLREFKKQDPFKAGAEIAPMTTYSSMLDNLRTCGLGGAFGIAYEWIDQDGTLVPYQMTDGFADYLNYLHGLYQEGLLDVEMPTNTSSTMTSKFTSGKSAAAMFAYWSVPGLMKTFAETDPNAKLEYGQPLSGDSAAMAVTDSLNTIGSYVVVPLCAKDNVANIMEFFNRMADPEIFKGVALGEENVDYVVNADGSYSPLDAFFEHRNTANEYLTGTTADYGKYWLARAQKNADQYAAYCQLNFDNADFVQVDPVSEVPCDVFCNIADARALSKSLTRDYIVVAVVEGVTDAGLQQFRDDWKVQCGDELTQTLNDWYQGR